MTEAELNDIRELLQIDWANIDVYRLHNRAKLLLAEVDRLRTAVQQEREACAQIANQAIPEPGHENCYADAFYDAADQIEQAIRQRGVT